MLPASKKGKMLNALKAVSENKFGNFFSGSDVLSTIETIKPE
jgi:hypothetical protein